MISPNTTPATTEVAVHADSQYTIWFKLTIPSQFGRLPAVLSAPRGVGLNGTSLHNGGAMTTAHSDLFRQVATTMAAAAESSLPADIERAVDLIDNAFVAGRKLLVFGNGGSSADAQHLVAELVGRFAAARAPLPAIALTTNQALLTAWSNDDSFDDVFSRQIAALGIAGDVALGISTSGASRNVLNALATARMRGLRTIGLTGNRAGALAGCCDLVLCVPAVETARVQEIHLVTYHAVCAALEQRLVARGRD
jgi:D-sedoheptulose 7-phosphate isomerase